MPSADYTEFDNREGRNSFDFFFFESPLLNYSNSSSDFNFVSRLLTDI